MGGRMMGGFRKKGGKGERVGGWGYGDWGIAKAWKG